ncbi:ATP-binding cassette domain-containing protein [candidate division WWE3 bacterium]|nr:ATP-binding cassette domain-containing protein [candidate division WWE3 bacterium]
MIEVKSISKTYGKHRAVNSASFTVDQGEVVGLLGPNGAGKTTTLNMITGVLVPDNGDIIIDGRSMKSVTSAMKKNIGYLAEDNPLYSNLLVSESLRLAADLKGMTTSQYFAQESKVIEATNIKEIYNQPIESLSKGFRQRVGLAQALLGDPKILILDEPTDGLDPNQRQEIRNLIGTLSKDHTILLSSHILQEVEAICQKVVIMNRGQVVAQGNLNEIAQQPTSQITIECKLEGDNKSEIVSTIQNRFSVEVTSKDSLIIRTTPDKENDLFKMLAEKTSVQAYLTELHKQTTNLEEAFRMLTKES